MAPSPRLCGLVIKNASHHCLKFLENEVPHRVPRKIWTSSQIANPIRRASSEGYCRRHPRQEECAQDQHTWPWKWFPNSAGTAQQFEGRGIWEISETLAFLLIEFSICPLALPSFPQHWGLRSLNTPRLVATAVSQFVRDSVTTGHRDPHQDTAADGDGSAITTLPQTRFLKQHKQTL